MKFLRPYITYIAIPGFFLAVTLPYTTFRDLISSLFAGVTLLVIYRLLPLALSTLKKQIPLPLPASQGRKSKPVPHPEAKWFYINRVWPLSLVFGAALALFTSSAFQLGYTCGIICFATITCATQEICKRKLSLA